MATNFANLGDELLDLLYSQEVSKSDSKEIVKSIDYEMNIGCDFKEVFGGVKE